MAGRDAPLKRTEGKEGEGVQACAEGCPGRHQPARRGLPDGHGACVPWDFSLALSVQVHSGPVGVGSLSMLGKVRQGVKNGPYTSPCYPNETLQTLCTVGVTSEGFAG